ncbi:MAG: DUF6020 family protein [Clostridium sp.]|nr:DUF6020 family protein [Clostridium sp.]
MKLKEKIKSVILAIISLLGIMMYARNIIQTDIIGSVSIITIILFVVYLYIWNNKDKFIKEQFSNKKGAYIIAIIISIIIGFNFSYGAILEKNIEQKWFITIPEILFLAIAILPFALIIINKLDNVIKQKEDDEGLKKYITPGRLIIIISIIWLIGYLAFWPGVYGYDAPSWIKNYVNSNYMTTHFSVVYVGVFALIIKLGYAISNSYTIAFGLFSFIQMTLVLLTIYKILQFINKKLGKKALLYTALFFVLIPTHFILAVSSAQDTAFMMLFALILMQFMEMAKEPQEYWKSKKFILFIVECIVFCLIRNNGIYIILIELIFTLFYQKGYRIKLAGCLLAAILLATITSTSLNKVLNVYKDPKGLNEMMSVPIMQLNRVYTYSPNVFSQEDKELYQEYIPEEGIQYYKNYPEISDNQKILINTDKLKKEPIKFAKLYIKIGLKDIRDYIKAPLYNMLGLWYPDKQYYDSRMFHPYIEAWCLDTDYLKGIDEEYVSIERHSVLPLCNKAIGALFGINAQYGNNDWKMYFNVIPLFSTFCKSGLYFNLYIAILIYSIYRKNKNAITVLGFGVGLLATVILGPVLLYRYVAPIIFSTPIWLSLIFEGKNKDEE